VVRRSMPERVDSRHVPAPRWRRRVFSRAVPPAVKARSPEETPSRAKAPLPPPTPKPGFSRTHAPAPERERMSPPVHAPRLALHAAATPAAFDSGAGDAPAAVRSVRLQADRDHGGATDAPEMSPSGRAATASRAPLRDRSRWTDRPQADQQREAVSPASPETAMDPRTSRLDQSGPEADADPETVEPFAAGPILAEERAAYQRIDRDMWPSVDAAFDRWPERDDWTADPDRPMHPPAIDTGAWRVEGRVDAAAHANPARPTRAARMETRLAPSSVARFSPSLSTATARPETPVRWPEDLSDRWPELPEDPSGPADRSAEELIRMSERLRRLATDQLGTRWNA
jgi:hypothetical protein